MFENENKTKRTNCGKHERMNSPSFHFPPILRPLFFRVQSQQISFVTLSYGERYASVLQNIYCLLRFITQMQ